MCDVLNPVQPIGGMGKIKFPEDGKPGSGDVITYKKRKRKKIYKEKPAKPILDFTGFVERYGSTYKSMKNTD